MNKPGDKVAVMQHKNSRTDGNLLAILKTGAAYDAVDPSSRHKDSPNP